MSKWFWGTLICIYASAPFAADLFACKKPDGNVVIQKDSCPDGQVGHANRSMTEGERLYEEKLRLQAQADKEKIEEKAHPKGAEINCKFLSESLIGLTKNAVIGRCGDPSTKNVTAFKNHSREQWVYGNGVLLYFDNGLVTSYQKSN